MKSNENNFTASAIKWDFINVIKIASKKVMNKLENTMKEKMFWEGNKDTSKWNKYGNTRIT